MGRPRKWASEAERQRVYRARKREAEAAVLRAGDRQAELALHLARQAHAVHPEPETPVHTPKPDPEPAPARRPGLISLEEHEEQLRGRELSYTLSSYSRL